MSILVFFSDGCHARRIGIGTFQHLAVTVADVSAVGYWADAAMLILQSFRYHGRYVDDMFSGPNPYLQRLLKTTDAVLGGFFTGLYPPSLRLLTSMVVSGDIVLCDKLTSSKFSKIHKLRYHHVFSDRALQCTYGVICGQLCRFASHTTLPDNWVQNAALCFYRLHLQGFETTWLHTQLQHWVHMHAEQCVGNTRIKYLSDHAGRRFLGML
jgi:hypothetical protein